MDQQDERFYLHDTYSVAVSQDNRSAHITAQVRWVGHQLEVPEPAEVIHDRFR